MCIKPIYTIIFLSQYKRFGIASLTDYNYIENNNRNLTIGSEVKCQILTNEETIYLSIMNLYSKIISNVRTYHCFNVFRNKENKKRHISIEELVPGQIISAKIKQITSVQVLTLPMID